MPPASMESPTTATVSLRGALDLGPEIWDRLLEPSRAPNPFLSWAWHRACADAVPPRDLDACHALVLRSAARDVTALLPFHVGERRLWGVPVTALSWAFGDLGCPDHRDILASPAADMDGLAAALEPFPWSIMKLGSVADAAANVRRFGAACERRGWAVRRRRQRRCPFLELPNSWDAYLERLSGHGRRALRRKERKLRRAHHVVLTDYGPERLTEGLGHLARLHTLRWRGGGAFRDPAVERLHHGFAAALADRHALWLTTLDLDGSPAAAWYGFAFGDTVYHYQSGRDPRWDRERVGTVLMSLMIRRAIAQGYRRLDFLRGEEPYKAEWTSTARPCDEVVIFRNGWRGAALRGIDWTVRHALRK